MNIFQIENNKVVVQTEALLIPNFKVIFDRDNSKSKEKAIAELSYVYFMADYKSLYLAYPESQRTKQITMDIVKDDKWIPDESIKSAIIKYEELQNTPTLRLLKSARHALEEACNYYNAVKPNDKNIIAISNSIGKIGEIAESLDKLENKIKRESQADGRSKGDRPVNPLEK